MGEPKPLDPYAPPRHMAEPPLPKLAWARFDGKLLSFDKKGALPDVCLKCAATSPIERREERFYDSWRIFLKGWKPRRGRPLADLTDDTMMRATLKLPLCASCNRRWRAAKTAIVLAGLSFLSPLFVVYLGPLTVSTESTIWTLAEISLIVFACVIVFYVRPRTIQAKRIDGASITLRGVHPRAAEVVVAAIERDV